jgi:hypothetical protein
VYHVSHFEASRNVILHTRYVSTCVGAGCGRGRGTKNKSYPLWSMLFLTYDMYKSSLRHIHYPVLSSLKMKGIRFLNRAMYEIMWRNITESDRSQTSIWRMRFACWILDTTKTESEYVILIAFPL